MILLFSTTLDRTTTDVMRWLHHLGCDDVLRINSDETDPERACRVTISYESMRFQVADRTFELCDIDALWYRKGRNWLANHFSAVAFDRSPELTEYFTRLLRAEKTSSPNTCIRSCAGPCRRSVRSTMST